MTEADIVDKISVMTIADGDVLVFKTGETLTLEASHRLIGLGDNLLASRGIAGTVLVLDRGMDIEILRKHVCSEHDFESKLL